MHLFEECDYICKATRSCEWKENKKIRNEMRQRLKIIETYKVIKNVFDTKFSERNNREDDQKKTTKAWWSI
jgi:hypothetical protein